MEKQTITRSGLPAMTFDGELIASADTAGDYSRSTRWHAIEVYRTAAGKFVVSVVYDTRWDGEFAHHYAAHCDSLQAVAAELERYTPTAHVQGYPEGDHYRHKQARLLADISRRWQAAVTEVLGELGVVEEVA